MDKKDYVVFRRTFAAAKMPAGSPARAAFNRHALTSEYMPSYKYVLVFPSGAILTFITKKEANETRIVAGES